MASYICRSGSEHVSCYRWNDDVRRLNVRVAVLRRRYTRKRVRAGSHWRR